MLPPLAHQSLPSWRRSSQNNQQLRDGRIGKAGVLCRPGRTQEKREGVSGGVSDSALALFGPLRAGSLTPTCLVSVVLQEAARSALRL